MPKAPAALAGQALACIDDPVVMEKILAHFDEKGASAEVPRQPRCRPAWGPVSVAK